MFDSLFCVHKPSMERCNEQFKRSNMAETVLQASKIRRKRTAYLALSTVVLLFLGLIYAFSLFAVFAFSKQWEKDVAKKFPRSGS